MRTATLTILALVTIFGVAGSAVVADSSSPTATYAGGVESGVLTLTGAPQTQYIVRFRAADGCWKFQTGGQIGAQGSATVAVAAPTLPDGTVSYMVQLRAPGGDWMTGTLIVGGGPDEDEGWLWD